MRGLIFNQASPVLNIGFTMHKDRFKSIQLFLKRLFFDTPAIIVICIFIMLGIAGYTIYQKELKIHLK